MKHYYILASIIILIFISCFSWITSQSLHSGNPAPDFKIMGDDNVMHSLSQVKESRVVLYFYPRDNTPGCTKQACSIAKGYENLLKHDIKILGINYQSPESHRAFKKEHHLPFTLLSDKNKKVAKAYGAYSWWHPMFPKRITVLIENGRVIKILENIDVTNHAQQILDAFNMR